MSPEVITPASISRVTPTRLFGPHDTFLTAIAYSQDGKWLVTGDLEGSLRVWNVATGDLLHITRLFYEPVLALAVGDAEQPDEMAFAVISRGGTVRLLRYNTALHTDSSMTTDSFTPLNIGYSSHNRPLIACIPTNAFDKRIYVMHADDKSFLHAARIGNDENPNVTFSTDGEIIAIGGADGVIALRSTSLGGRSLYKVRTSLNGVRATALSSDVRRIAAREDRGDRLCVYDVRSGEQIGTEINMPFLNDFAFNHDGTLLAVTTQQKGGSLHIYTVETGERVRRLKGSSPIAFSPAGDGFAAGNDYAEFSKSVMLWDTTQSERGVLHKIGAVVDNVAAETQYVQQFGVLQGAHKGRVLSLAFSPDGMTLATGGTDDDIRLWDLATGGQNVVLRDHRADVTGLTFSPDGKTLASCSGYFNNQDDNTVRMWETNDWTPTFTFSKHRDRVVKAIYHPRGELMISADDGGRIYVWRVSSGDVIRTIETPSPINHIALSPDGALVASAHGSELAIKDTSLRLWNTQTGEMIREYTEMSDWVMNVTFSRDGNVLLGADYSKRVCGWDMNSGEVVLDLAIGTLARYNPKNDLIAIAHEKVIDLIAVRGGQIKMQLRHGEDVSEIAFNGGGELLAAGLTNGDVVLWGVPEGAGTGVSTSEVEQIRVKNAARSGRYALQLISLSCNRAQERDGDEVFIRLDDQTIWRVTQVGRKMRQDPQRPNEIDTFDFSSCRMHGKDGWQSTDKYDKSEFRLGGLTGPIELELWEADLFFRGGDDFFGRVTITPAQAGQNMIRTVLETAQASYTLTYGVLFE